MNEKVQAAVNALKETYDIDAIKYNAEKKVTKVKVTSKADQSKNKFYFDNEGVETTWEKPAKDVEKETKTEEEIHKKNANKANSIYKRLIKFF